MPKTLWEIFDNEPNREEPTMNTYAEVKAGTPCRIFSDYTRNDDFTYPEDDLLKVSFERTNSVSCGYFTFNKSDVRIIKL